MTVETSRAKNETSALVPVKVKDALEPYPQNKYTWLLPTAYMGQSELFRPVAVVVEINPGDKREVYDTPGGGGTVCLHSQALERIANATGIDFDPVMKRHIHDFKNEPWICTIDVGGWYIDSLGQRRRISAGAKMDLRDGSPRAALLTRQTAKALEVARQFICEQNESRARNRAIRHATNLPSSFTRQELAKPMVALRFQLDERHPDVRRALIAQGTHAAGEVFGNPVGPALDAGGDDRDQLEDLQGQFVETTGTVEAEPEIPDAGAPEAAAPAEVDINALIAPILRAAAHQPDKSPVGDPLLLTLGTAFRDVLGVKTGKAASAARLSIAQLIYGPEITVARNLTGGQAHALLDLTKQPDGQAVIRALFAHQLAHDDSIAWVKDELAQKAAA